MAAHFEIERKFLIARPDPAVLSRQPGLAIWEIDQTYLAEGGRIRRILCDGQKTFIHTVKQDRTDLTRVEEERQLDEAAYETLLTHRAEGSITLKKTRYRFAYDGHTVEVDLFPFWSDRALAEVELQREDERFSLPGFLRVIKEVTADKRYRNSRLANEILTEPITL